MPRLSSNFRTSSAAPTTTIGFLLVGHFSARSQRTIDRDSTSSTSIWTALAAGPDWFGGVTTTARVKSRSGAGAGADRTNSRQIGSDSLAVIKSPPSRRGVTADRDNRGSFVVGHQSTDREGCPTTGFSPRNADKLTCIQRDLITAWKVFRFATSPASWSGDPHTEHPLHPLRRHPVFKR